jgi:hypothetical protein
MVGGGVVGALGTNVELPPGGSDGLGGTEVMGGDVVALSSTIVGNCTRCAAAGAAASRHDTARATPRNAQIVGFVKAVKARNRVLERGIRLRGIFSGRFQYHRRREASRSKAGAFAAGPVVSASSD